MHYDGYLPWKCHVSHDTRDRDCSFYIVVKKAQPKRCGKRSFTSEIKPRTKKMNLNEVPRYNAKQLSKNIKLNDKKYIAKRNYTWLPCNYLIKSILLIIFINSWLYHDVIAAVSHWETELASLNVFRHISRMVWFRSHLRVKILF